MLHLGVSILSCRSSIASQVINKLLSTNLSSKSTNHRQEYNSSMVQLRPIIHLDQALVRSIWRDVILTHNNSTNSSHNSNLSSSHSSMTFSKWIRLTYKSMCQTMLQWLETPAKISTFSQVILLKPSWPTRNLVSSWLSRKFQPISRQSLMWCPPRFSRLRSVRPRTTTISKVIHQAAT